jgi:UDP-2,4-diacetamido-2,4,6-trideoxy-beta-L-altropyranose hydrolase
VNVLNIILIAFGDEKSGSGHIRRCITLAQALLRHPNVRLTYLTNLYGKAIVNKSLLSHASKQDYFRLVVVNGPLAAIMKSYDICQSMQGVIAFIVDSYLFDKAFERQLRPITDILMVIDDLANRAHDCDILLDQNANRKKEDYFGLVRKDTIFLIGENYTLLRQEFVQWRSKALDFQNYRIAENVASCDLHMFVSLGGGDPLNILPDLIKLSLEEFNGHITIATGSRIERIAEVQQLAILYKKRVNLNLDASNIAELMSGCDFALAATGTMAWERASLGLPSIGLVIADNQAETAQYLAKHGFHLMLDIRKNLSQSDIAAKLNYMRCGKHRKRLQMSAKQLIDGMGAHRVADKLIERMKKKATL